mmetsp:Transcript_48788/g.86876  ORF Transcript_48788/g.86876 Transcript_48788/m.86876 type:complete len:309 (+) Transcript_48788:2074-3000(+)
MELVGVLLLPFLVVVVDVIPCPPVVAEDGGEGPRAADGLGRAPRGRGRHGAEVRGPLGVRVRPVAHLLLVRLRLRLRQPQHFVHQLPHGVAGGRLDRRAVPLPHLDDGLGERDVALREVSGVLAEGGRQVPQAVGSQLVELRHGVVLGGRLALCDLVGALGLGHDDVVEVLETVVGHVLLDDPEEVRPLLVEVQRVEGDQREEVAGPDGPQGAPQSPFGGHAVVEVVAQPDLVQLGEHIVEPRERVPAHAAEYDAEDAGHQVPIILEVGILDERLQQPQQLRQAGARALEVLWAVPVLLQHLLIHADP